ncbi:bifunctional 2-polyprenyl-6-hydroxyphenol methylase/3-demethylubiquinol 3-O-methyltransferase UbiG [Janthinobacterium sp. B9-8]|uniref:bifunctional 2-polyprenyl-6-hydroxyphenol methylase/3-demethylubiquinol 3-O-methyltransferase UbiG n=1 Tax=Janthinobacterium sp. B9-8 TaxID=1236179 RepID=UPI00061D0862|nr:bifunctional 2-polyprenyl-6-hydroxyphenol methylase/3-demethylubiquinol 3-O-methyltransferase UbiG [Janthinobacterium sp. B9-8]AMC35300.1 bifunctional 3-demethylubiquinol 3-O-methyltransferase/2-polyprenyl-6-hydroxyphenol methylase [Janthinobacterium sp. B9-8]
MTEANINVDPSEIAKFSALAHKWWDTESEFKPLHEINPLRIDFMQKHVELAGKKILDIGCGGGILAEGLARQGANVTGIDLAEKSLKVAKLHLFESKLEVDYRCVPVEQLATEEPESYDIVTCMEMLEHVPSPASVVAACARLVKPGGWVFFSTLNRNAKSYMLAVVGAEYVLGMLPRGTHDYAKFIKPSELARMTRNAEIETVSLSGLSYNPLTKIYKLDDDAAVNYLIATRKAP